MDLLQTTHRRRAGGCPFAASAGSATVPPTRCRPRGRRPAPIDGLTLARRVTGEVRRLGKHFLPTALLARLAEVRERHGGGDPYLDAFLDCMLDKHDGRFHNRTYLALPLLERLMADPSAGVDAERLATLLISDVVRFETAARGGADGPDPRTLHTRLKHARRFVSGTEPLDDLPAPPAGPAGEWFDLTVAPVHVLHDEYFFIRVLQAHEMVFTVLAGDVRAATRALRARSVEESLDRLDHAITTFGRAATLFRIVATMRPATFHAFRQFTQGASAIQSEQYKRFEVACGRPAAERLRSDAFTSVPAVRVGDDDLSRAYLDGGFSPRHRDQLDLRLTALETAHQRWKAAHHGLAARMLGDDTPGSGYTSGVPYLRACLDNRLFGHIARYSGM